MLLSDLDLRGEGFSITRCLQILKRKKTIQDKYQGGAQWGKAGWGGGGLGPGFSSL